MVAYGTYNRVAYQTVSLPRLALSATLMALLKVLGWLLLGVVGVGLGVALFGGIYMLAMMVLPYVGQALLAAAVLVIVPWATRPR